MKGYLKAAVFIAVLLFSVSLMSAAIDILGNISDIDLDTEPQSEKTAAEPAGTVDVGKGKGKRVEVEGAPEGGVYPLFEIRYPPRTKYLRRRVGEIYENGAWEPSEVHKPIPYNGEVLELNVEGYETFEPVSFAVRPLFNLSGFIPVTLSVFQLEFEGTLERYPSMEAYSSPTLFSSTYGVSYAKYDFSEANLRAAQPNPLSYCLDVPEELLESLRGLASKIVGDLSTPYEKLKALEQYLKKNYDYDEDYDPAPPDMDPVEWFLFNSTSGVCTQFNSAFVLLARSIGLPARMVYGYLIKPEAEFQFVMSKQAHVYAEAPFKGLGWITFDATPERMEDKPQSVSRIPTLTNITGNDAVGIKGGHFKVYGMVTTHNGSAVDGLAVEVFLMVSKNETGVLSGRGGVRDGLFNITCEASADLEVGDYMLVAHALGNALYQESWSDPPIRIVAETVVTIDAPGRVYVGESIALTGRLIEKSSGQPIANLTVFMQVGDEVFSLTTDSAGTVAIPYTFDAEGNRTIALSLEDTEYYLGSSSAVGIAVTAPPPPQRGLLYMLTIFPYNVILAAAFAASISAVILAQRRRRHPHDAVEGGAPQIEIVEGDLAFDSFKEGIVKLFNRFYASTQRRYSDVRESLTPREFQRLLLGKIPEKGVCALEDLVTAFEVANYSEAHPSKEEYDRCQAAVDMLSELMEHG